MFDAKTPPKPFGLYASALSLAAILSLAAAEAASQSPKGASPGDAKPSLEETRLAMDKWIETQQIISKERKEWQQGKEILAGRLDLVKKEIDSLDGKIKQAQTGISETDDKRKELLAQDDEAKAAGAQLTEKVAGMEEKMRTLFKQLPDPIQTKLRPLFQRIPEDPAKTRVSAAERFQNILGILNELDKANNEISVNYEVHTLADGKPSEVQAIYIGLGQAYYVSARGEAGIGRPSPDGWKWEPSKTSALDIVTTLDILQGKHTPAFVPMPVKIQ